MPQYKFIVMTNPVEGREDEYNDWYDNVHLDDVLAVEGFTAAKRYKAAPEQTGDVPWRYLTIYEIETEDLGKTLRTLNEIAGTEAMTVTDAIDAANTYSVAYKDLHG